MAIQNTDNNIAHHGVTVSTIGLAMAAQKQGLEKNIHWSNLPWDAYFMTSSTRTPASTLADRLPSFLMTN